jgi:hypothetical protein
MRINGGPPFSALLTLWLSMMAAVGLASRSSFSRQSEFRVLLPYPPKVYLDIGF